MTDLLALAAGGNDVGSGIESLSRALVSASVPPARVEYSHLLTGGTQAHSGITIAKMHLHANLRPPPNEHSITHKRGILSHCR